MEENKEIAVEETVVEESNIDKIKKLTQEEIEQNSFILKFEDTETLINTVENKKKYEKELKKGYDNRYLISLSEIVKELNINTETMETYTKEIKVQDIEEIKYAAKICGKNVEYVEIVPITELSNESVKVFTFLNVDESKVYITKNYVDYGVILVNAEKLESLFKLSKTSENVEIVSEKSTLEDKPTKGLLDIFSKIKIGKKDKDIEE